ncbi:MAG: hypothetical protein CW335_08270 [Clostridiales bacterium]|jgi:hypothetical protein|nr:hypothetical protein [Clostridiales bacterium]
MGLFSKEACTFCGKEVGMMHRSKLKTKEYICSDCRNKTNPYARMDYTSRDAAQRMMEAMPQDAAWLDQEIARLEDENAEKKIRFVVQDRHDYDLGSKHVVYTCVHTLGVFQLYCSDQSHYAYNPVLFFDHILPYRFDDGNTFFADARRMEIMDANAKYATVSESKDPDGKITSCELIIPYQDECIQQIRISSSVRNEDECKAFYALADQINKDRRICIEQYWDDIQRKERMQVRNLGDTAAAALKAAVKGESVEATVKEGLETANAIEEGKVKQGLFGKLFKK